MELETEEASVECTTVEGETILCTFNGNENEFTAMLLASEDSDGQKKISIETDNARIVDVSDNLVHTEIKELTEKEEEVMSKKIRKIMKERHPNLGAY